MICPTPLGPLRLIYVKSLEGFVTCLTKSATFNKGSRGQEELASACKQGSFSSLRSSKTLRVAKLVLIICWHPSTESESCEGLALGRKCSSHFQPSKLNLD